MATLCIEATPSDDLFRYELRLDNFNNDFIGADGRGCIELPDNVCGDGSIHILWYLVDGPIGATLRVKLFCDDAQIRDYNIEIYSPGGEIQGDAEFDL